MIRSFRTLVPLVAVVLLVGSCVDGNAPLDPNQGLSMRVPIAATILPSASDAAADPINRIRAVAERVPDGVVLGSTVVDVSATADEWEIELELPVSGAGVSFVVYLELIHVDAAGTEAVQFSGRTAPLPLVAGPVGGTETGGGAVEVEVVRGPPANLFVTGITVTGGDRTIGEGESTDLAAEVQSTAGAQSPTVFWTSLDPTIVSVASTSATGVAPGVGHVVATAGPVSDTISVTVLAGPGSVTIDPDTIQLAAPGAQGTFLAEVLDTQGQPYSDQTVTWESLDPAVIQSSGGGAFSAIAPGTGRLQARASADTSLTALGVVVVADPTVDVAIAKSVDQANAMAGDTVTFTLTASSIGVADAQNVVVLDTLPTGLLFLSATPSSGTYDAATGLWSIGVLLTDSVATLTMATRVEPGFEGTTLDNEAKISADSTQTDTDAANDAAIASVTITLNQADLLLTKTVNASTPFEGDTLTYTVTVTNLGPGSFNTVTVIDVVPTGLTFVSAVANAGAGAYDPVSGHWVFALPSGTTTSLALRAKVDLGTAGQTIVNTASIAAALGAIEINTSNDQDSVSVVPVPVGPAADIELTKTVSDNNPAEGDTVVFRVTVKNLGPDTATTVLLFDPPPAGLIPVPPATLSANVVSLPGDQYRIDTLAVGDSATLDLPAEIGSGTMGTSLTNTVNVVSLDQNDLVAGNDVASSTVNVQGPPVDLQVVKSASAGSLPEGDTVQYTIQVTNLGSQPATGVVVYDSVTAPGTVVSATGAGAYATASGLWTVGTIGPGATATLNLSVAFALGSGGSPYTNTAYVQALNETDTSPANDTAMAVVSVLVQPVDVEVTKTVSSTLALVAQTLSYTVRVKNVGANAATNVVVTDTIPAGLTVDSTTTSAGSLTNDTTWTIPTLLPGDSASASWHVTVGAGQVGNTLVNRAYRSGVDQNDTNGANDIDSVSVLVVPDTPPVVTISAPTDGDVYNPSDTIAFAGTATDVEDGTLTPLIAWASDQDGSIGTGAGFSTFNLSPGPHVITASVTDSQGTTVADSVGITIAIISTAPTLNVPFGGSASLPISLSAAAPIGGITVNVASSNNAIASPQTATVFIPAGAFSANAALDGLAPGTTNVSITSTGFGSSTSSVSVTAQLNIIENSLAFSAGFTETFRVRLESQGTPIAAPAGGLLVTLTSSDATCAAPPATVTIPAGLVDITDTIQYGGSATLSCAAVVTATATSITPDSVPVTVNNAPGISQSTVSVGAGLQISRTAFLGIANHGGRTVRFTSTDSSKVLVSPNASTPGAGHVDIPVANGVSNFTYYVQALDGTTGSVPVVASAPGFVPDTTSMTVVQPGLILASVSLTSTSLNPDDHFYVYVGTPSGNSVLVQNRRAGGPPLVATVASSDTTVGFVKDSIGSADTVTTTISAGQYFSPNSVANGGVAFDPAGPGSATVTASIPGFLQQVDASRTVTVSAPQIFATNSRVGSGLQRSANGALGASNHGGVTVRVTSQDSTKLLISPNSSTPGTGFIDVVVANGVTSIPMYVQGLEGQTGNVDYTITAPGFVSDTTTVTVEQPGVILASLTTSTTSLNPDDHFYAYVGILSGNSVSVQNIRAGGVPIPVTAASSDTTVGFVKDSLSARDTVVATIPVLSYFTPNSVANGGFAFDPVGPGSTTISATSPGLISQPNASYTVSVSAPTINAASTTVGSGLHRSAFSSLGASNHGGVTAQVTSLDSTVLLLAPDNVTPGVGSLTIPVVNGGTSLPIYVQGIEGQTGAIPMVISAPGFVPDTSIINVVQPGVILASLTTSSTTLNPDDHFYAYVGIPSGNSVSVQNVRPGAPPVNVTFNSSQVSVGQLKDSATSAATVMAQIPTGSYFTPTSVASGGVAFDPVGPGSTTITATVPGYISQPNATQTVSVSIPGIFVSNTNVGAGLQRSLGASLGASNHGGVTVRVTSSNPAVMQVSPDQNTAGQPFIDVVVPQGSSGVSYYVQGVEGATGATTVTVAAPGFTDGTSTVTVVQPGVIVAGLGTSKTVGAADDHFYAYVGIPSGNSVSVQNVRAGGTPLTVTITSSDGAVGDLTTTALTGTSVTSTITPGLYYTPGSVGAGGMAFRSLGIGTTNVTVSVPGFITQPNGTVTVTVN